METEIKIRRIVSHGRERWECDIPAKISGKKRMRPTFEDEITAETYSMKFLAQIKEHGTRSLDAKGVTVTGALKKFWKLKEMKDRHKAEAEHVLGLFEDEHGSTPIELISPVDLLTFWRMKRGKKGAEKPWSPTTQAKAFRYLRLFFNWCERYDLIERNPARRVEPPKADDPRKNILTPDEMAEFLKVADPVFRAFLCLGGFAGIRTCELVTLKGADVEKKEIQVNAGTKDERWVTRTKAFNRHWQGLPAFPSYPVKFYKHVRKVVGAKWSPNCLRHSFGTYHLAMWESAGGTAIQMGNSETMVRGEYARAVKKAEAVKWWAL